MLDKILEQMNWRKAVKAFDSSKKLNEDQVNSLIETARLAPTSYGLQPFMLYVVSDQEMKQKLFEVGYQQTQFSTASHVFVLVVREKISQSDIDEQIKRSAHQTGVSTESLAPYRLALEKNIGTMLEEKAFVWASRQAYLVLGMMLATATQLQVDASPMEGFNKSKFDEILGCDKLGYKSVVCFAAGFRDNSHSYVERPKVRKNRDEFVKFV